jgi:hypothetical protein
MVNGDLVMNHRMRKGTLALSLLGLAACSETVGPDSALEESVTLDVAMIAADAAIDEFRDMALLFGGGALPVFGGEGLPAPMGMATHDRPGTHTATFFDADGTEQDARDPLTTASVHLVIESTHEFSRDSWSGTGTRSRDVLITGLEGEETTRTVNGTGSGTVDRSQHTDEDGTRTYDMTSASVIEDVVHPVPRTDVAWPVSGTITRDVTVNIVNGPNGDVSETRHVVITFNGTNLPTMTIDGEIFEIDLATRSGRRPFRKRG